VTYKEGFLRILFVASEVIASEPMGILQLSAICKNNGHETKLVTLDGNQILKIAQDFKPHVIAYSAMTADITAFKKADLKIQNLINSFPHKVLRIMGGPHPTYFKEVLNEMNLDAICVGEGDYAITKVLEKFKTGLPLVDIPNILSKDQSELIKELPSELDDLPFADRDILYDYLPHYQYIGLRSFVTARGCAFNCSYCYVHAYNEMFKGYGDVVRRRSPDDVISEIKEVITRYPQARLIRFADDTFIYNVNEWFLEFSQKYKEQIGLPFYCLMRSNTFTEEIAKILADMGCIAVGMSIESGDAKMRSRILKRYIPDKTIKASFDIAKKYGINTYANTMLALPGGSLEDDFNSFRFARDLKVTAPTYSVFCPYPGLQLTNYALENGYLEEGFNYENKYGSPSVLNCYTDKEKNIQVRLQHLGPMFTVLPKFLSPLLYLLVKLPLTALYHKIGALFEVFILSTKVFRGIYPKNPIIFAKIALDSIKYAHKSADENEGSRMAPILNLEGGPSRDIKKG
tara:strand:- start:83713 stop:85260 length:1548 start_codon:yes stop_codon:yes gene_type:complete